MSDYLTLIGSIIVSVLGGGGFGAWLMHRRLSPKSHAEAADITAAAIDKDWARYQREINRLVERCEKAEDKAEKAEAKAERALRGQRECEAREARYLARIARLEAIEDARGHARQEAAGIIAMERLASKDNPK